MCFGWLYKTHIGSTSSFCRRKMETGGRRQWRKTNSCVITNAALSFPCHHDTKNACTYSAWTKGSSHYVMYNPKHECLDMSQMWRLSRTLILNLWLSGGRGALVRHCAVGNKQGFPARLQPHPHLWCFTTLPAKRLARYPLSSSLSLLKRHTRLCRKKCDRKVHSDKMRLTEETGETKLHSHHNLQR